MTSPQVAFRRRWLIVLLLAAVGIGVHTTRRAWLTGLGNFLINTDTPQPAEIVVVLAGGIFGERIMKAAELVRQGYAPRVLVDGPRAFYGLPESDLAIPFALRHGAPEEIFEAFPINAQSTKAEAVLVDQELRRRGIRKALVVTSNYHTRRARNIFRKHGSGDVEYFFIGSSHPVFHPQRWWHTREGKKQVVLEYSKTVYSWFE